MNKLFYLRCKPIIIMYKLAFYTNETTIAFEVTYPGFELAKYNKGKFMNGDYKNEELRKILASNPKGFWKIRKM